LVYSVLSSFFPSGVLVLVGFDVAFAGACFSPFFFPSLLLSFFFGFFFVVLLFFC